MAVIEIWTDGSGTTGLLPAGWAAILVSGPYRKEICGHLPLGTNNQAELSAVINALLAVKGVGHQITIYTDSQYVIGSFYATYKAKRNKELIERMRKLGSRHTVILTWLRGHNGDPNNERCDELANAARLDYIQKGETVCLK